MTSRPTARLAQRFGATLTITGLCLALGAPTAHAATTLPQVAAGQQQRSEVPEGGLKLISPVTGLVWKEGDRPVDFEGYTYPNATVEIYFAMYQGSVKADANGYFKLEQPYYREKPIWYMARATAPDGTKSVERGGVVILSWPERFEVFMVNKEDNYPLGFRWLMLPRDTQVITVNGHGTPGDRIHYAIDKGASGSFEVSPEVTWEFTMPVTGQGANGVTFYAEAPDGTRTKSQHIEVGVGRPAQPIWRVPGTPHLYRVGYTDIDFRTLQVTFDQWLAWGQPEPQDFPSEIVKMPWSDTVYTLSRWAPQMATTWTLRRLTFDQWASLGAPKPTAVQYVIGAKQYTWGTSDEVFTTFDGKTHKLTFNEWVAYNAELAKPPYKPMLNTDLQRLDYAGFTKVAGSDVVYKMTNLSANRGAPITWSQWVAEGMPTPKVISTKPTA